jgi:hypothetical protein
MRSRTALYDRIRQSYSSIYGAQMFLLYLLSIFVRSPYTESVSHRISPCTRFVYGSRARSLYISVFLRKRSFTIVHVRPGYSFAIELNELYIHHQTNLNLSKCFYLSNNIVKDGCKIFIITLCCCYKIVVEPKNLCLVVFTHHLIL